MMNKNDVMSQIQRDLEELKCLIIILNQKELEKKKNDLLPEGSVKKQIYDLCDGLKTISRIANILGKSNQYVGSYISILRREGLIRKIKKDGVYYHEQIF